MEARVLLAPFDAQAALAGFSARNGGAGAIASFIGLCRAEGGAVEALELEHYPGFTEKEIARLMHETARRLAVNDILVLHRAGRIAPGEAIVLVAAASAHRAEAFKAVEALMDYLKTDAPFWKREHRADGAHWIEPTAQDRARTAAQGKTP